MTDRLLAAVAVIVAALIASSHLMPSPWPGEAAAPARLARAAKRPAEPAPVSFAGMELREGALDRTVVGSIPAAPAARPSDDATARVVVKAEQTVAISAEINARIIQMPYREGDHFQAGAMLVEFDCARTRAELASATAALNLTRNAHDTARQLHKLGAAGVYNVRQTQFESEKAAADVETLRAKAATCVIRAPFEGVVAEKLAATHEVVGPNQPLLRIVDTGEPELQLIAPSAWLDWLSVGLGFEVELDETHRRYPARVQAVSGAVDPVSQTVRVLARFETRSAEVAPGMSGAARFARTEGGR